MVYTVELWVTIVVDKFRYETNEYNREDLGMRIESDSSLSLSLSPSFLLSLPSLNLTQQAMHYYNSVLLHSHVIFCLLQTHLYLSVVSFE